MSTNRNKLSQGKIYILMNGIYFVVNTTHFLLGVYNLSAVF